MANRNWSSPALVLSVRSFGEGHREASLLLPAEHGSTLLKGSVFGGAKSKLKGLVIPYHSGTVWLYSNPVKNTDKITDFEVKNYRAGLRENLTRLWAAAFAAELAEKLKGNIDWLLINSFLNGLEISSEQECKTALLRFIWRLIYYSGMIPDFRHCTRCCKEISGTAHFIPHEQNFICGKCINIKEFFFPIDKEASAYLSAVLNLPPKISRQAELSEKAFLQLRSLLFYLAENMIGTKLKTLEANRFIL